MKKILHILFVVGVLTAMITTPVLAGTTISPRLLAGQTNFAGVIKVSGYPDYLHFVFTIRGGAGWCMTDAAIHVGLSLDEFPQNAGGAIPGQFEFQYDFGGCIVGATIDVPITGRGWYGNWIYVAVHANVIGPDGQQETAWTVNCGDLEGNQFPGNNWSAYFRYPANAWY